MPVKKKEQNTIGGRKVFQLFIGFYSVVFLLVFVGLTAFAVQVYRGKDRKPDFSRTEITATAPVNQPQLFVQKAVTKIVEAATSPPAPTAIENSAERVRRGESLFNANCAACHQMGAEGKVGFAPSIRNRDFLALASDDFIKKTIKGGRPGTAMPPRPDLSDYQIEGIVAYLRSLPVSNPVAIKVDPHKSYIGNPEAGKTSFNTYCAACHGEEGRGYSDGGSGPGIGLPGFLGVASDDFIFQTLKQGRIGTAMKPFIGVRGVANLSIEEASDIITYLRSLQTVEKGAVAIFRPPGTQMKAADFLALCEGCPICSQACPYEAIFHLGPAAGALEGTPVLDPNKNACHWCPDMPCIHSCPTGALTLDSEKK